MSDQSPFDKDKEYFYSNVEEYHLNKAIQLYNVRNFDLALKEFQGINDYFIRLKDSKNISLSEKYINLLSDKIFQRDKKRELFSRYSDFDNFFTTANYFEEYYSLLPNLRTSKIIETYNPLSYIIETGEVLLNKGINVFLLFDLDATLLDNTPRVYKIMQEFIKDYYLIYPEEIEKLKNLKRRDIVWGLKQNLKKVGIDPNEKFMKEIFKFWYERFFSNDYIIDVPIKGSVEFVNKAKEIGFEIVYLTGRFESMRKGTIENLEENNFPIKDKNKDLVMKPSDEIADHDFKHIAMDEIKKYGYILAGFDNEPINVNIFKDHLPDSEIFFIETNHSLNPPNLKNDIHTISNFIME